MSYTLSGRIQTRLLAALPALLAAWAIHHWWAIEAVALMLLFGVLLDRIYDRVLDYQPAWVALPLGALELGLLMLAMHPLRTGGYWLFAAAWLSAQLAAHVVLPRLRLEYAESGGELGSAKPAAAVALAAAAGAVGAYASLPPTVHLHGVVQGPLVIRHSQTLVGGVVKGGILIRASHVTLNGVHVVGGENGVDIEDADHVMLIDVHVSGVTLDGIHARRSSVMIDRCTVSSPHGPWVQGIDLSFAMDKEMSMVERCTISGVREGIVTHWMMADLKHNHVSGTTLRGIDMGEMSMGTIAHNTVVDSKGVGILCLDHYECTIEHNTIAGAELPIQEQFFAHAKLHHNTID